MATLPLILLSLGLVPRSMCVYQAPPYGLPSSLSTDLTPVTYPSTPYIPGHSSDTLRDAHGAPSQLSLSPEGAPLIFVLVPPLALCLFTRIYHLYLPLPQGDPFGVK